MHEGTDAYKERCLSRCIRILLLTESSIGEAGAQNTLRATLTGYWKGPMRHVQSPLLFLHSLPPLSPNQVLLHL